MKNANYSCVFQKKAVSLSQIWRKMKKHILLILFLCWTLAASAVDKSYYNSLDGKSGTALREALTELLYTKHTTFVSYNWDFPYDYDNEGNMLDIYSSCGYNSHNNYPTSYKCCCDAVNREHVVCQSSFGGSANNGKVPQYSDRHHLYPVDGRANGHRSDLPFGECSGGKHGSCSSSSTIIPSEGTSTCANHEYGRSGASTFSVALPSGGGSVYEVGDEYKGDIARAILYMVVRYADKAHCRLPDGAKNATATLKTQNDYPVTAWANTTRDKVGQMFSSSLNTNYGLSEYGKLLLLKWHRQDPVSAKEMERNNGVEEVQGNRNPFVDYPCLVEYLWGEHAEDPLPLAELVGSFQDGFSGEGCTSTGNTPSIFRPTGTIGFGTTSTGVPIQKSVTVQGTNLTGTIYLSVTGTNASYFSLSQASMSQNVANSGKAITINYTPAATGEHTATLHITGGGLSEAYDVPLTGSCCNPYSVTLYRNGQPEVINACGTYNLPAANTEEDACDGWTFSGWSTSQIAETTTTPSFTTSVNAEATLYAVYEHTTGNVTDTTLTMKEYAAISGSFGSFTFAAVKNNGSTAPTYNSTNKDARLYAKGTLTISNSQTMTQIVFNLSTQGKKRLAPITASTGAIVTQDSLDTEVTWTGSANSVSFTVGDKADYGSDGSTEAGQLCFSSVTITRTTGSTTYKSIPCPMQPISFAHEAGIAEGGQYFVSVAAAIAGTTVLLLAEPDDGYTFGAWDVYKMGEPGTKVDVTNNQFTMPAYGVTISATFNEIPTFTATWYANGNVFATQNGLYDEATPDLPNNPADCSSNRIFMGWTAQSNYKHATEQPADLFTTTAPAIDGANVTFYAVYADTTKTPGPGSSSYNRINSVGSLTNGEYLIVYEAGNLIFNGGLATLDVASNTITGLTITNHTIASSTRVDTATFTITAVTGGYTICAAKGLYIGQNANDNGLGTNANSATYTNSIGFTGDSVDIYGSKNAYLRYNSTAGQLRFRYYKLTSYQNQQPIQLYKKVTTPGALVTTYSNYSLHCSEATYTATFMAKGNEHATRSGHTDEEMTAVSEPEGCNNYAFVGWSTTQYAADNTTTPNLNYTGRVPGANTTYYAVYSNAGSVAKIDDYQRITQLSELTTGNYVIVAENDSLCALSTTIKDTYYLAGVKVVPVAEIISNPAASIIWYITVNGNMAKLYNEASAGYLYAEQNGKYCNILVGNNLLNNSFTYGVSDNKWTFTSVTYPTQVLEYYTGATRWAFYKSPDAPIYLYKQKPDPNADVFYTTSPSCSVTPTGIEQNGQEPKSTCQKLIKDGTLYIIRGDKVYNLQGQELRKN